MRRRCGAKARRYVKTESAGRRGAQPEWLCHALALTVRERGCKNPSKCRVRSPVLAARAPEEMYAALKTAALR